MTFFASIKVCFKKYVTFSGRASRAEYWWFALFVLVAFWSLRLLDEVLHTTGSMMYPSLVANTLGDNGLFSFLFGYAAFLPYLAVTARRFHDIEKSGWTQLVMLVPLVGSLIIIYFFVQKGTEGANRFGPDPLSDSRHSGKLAD